MSGRDLMLRTDKLNCQVHINPELEILYVTSGCVSVFDGNSTTDVYAGEATLIFPYQFHGFVCSENTIAKVFMFSQAITQDFYYTYKAKEIERNKIKIAPQLHTFIEYSLKSLEQDPQVLTIKSLFYAIAADFLRNIKTLQQNNQPSLSIQEVVEYVFSHLSEELTLQNLAHTFGVNKHTLNAMFQNAVNLSFSDFLRNVRIEHSRALLTTTSMSITEIAFECGFGCVRTFNRAFVNHLGCTPTDYRKG